MLPQVESKVAALPTKVKKDGSILIAPPMTLTIKNYKVAELDFDEKYLRKELKKFGLNVSDETLEACIAHHWSDRTLSIIDEANQVYVSVPCSCQRLIFRFEKMREGIEYQDVFNECPEKIAKALNTKGVPKDKYFIGEARNDFWIRYED